MTLKNIIPSKSKLDVRSATAIAILGVLTWQSGSIPFIPSKEYCNLLAWVGTPLVTICLVYHVFFQQDKLTNMTTYQTKIKELNSQFKRLAWHIAAGPIILGVALLVSFVSQWYPAIPTKYLTSHEGKIEAEINDVRFNRKIGEARIYLTDLDTGDTIKIFWSQEAEATALKKDDFVVLHTKKNWFGHYV